MRYDAERRLAVLVWRWRGLRRARRLAVAAAVVGKGTTLIRAAVAHWDGQERSLPLLLAALTPALRRLFAPHSLPPFSPPELTVADAARRALRDEEQRTLLAVVAVHKLVGQACGELLRGAPVLTMAADALGWDPAQQLLRAVGVDEQAEAERCGAVLAAGRAGWRACRRHRLERALLAWLVAAAYAAPATCGRAAAPARGPGSAPVPRRLRWYRAAMQAAIA